MEHGHVVCRLTVPPGRPAAILSKLPGGPDVELRPFLSQRRTASSAGLVVAGQQEKQKKRPKPAYDASVAAKAILEKYLKRPRNT